MCDFLNSSCWERKEKYYIRTGVSVDTQFSKEQQDGLLGIEDGSWWFNYRAQVIISLLDRYFDKNKLLIDVGGGNGFTTSKAKAAGFDVLYSNYFMEFLYLPILLVRVGLERLSLLKSRSQRTEEEQERITKAQFEKKRGLVGAVLNTLEKIELKRLASDRKVRFGSSVILVLKKNNKIR